MQGIRNKENAVPLGCQKSVCGLQMALNALQQQLSVMRKEYAMSEREHMAKAECLRAQANEYKRKVGQLSERYVISSLVQVPAPSDKNLQEQGKDLLIEDLQERVRALAQDNAAQQQQIDALTKANQRTKMEKDKNMEISLLEKIQLEDRISILEQQVQSKHNIACNLQKELHKVHSVKTDTHIQQRKIQKQSRELQNISKELEQYSHNYQKKFESKIRKIQDENTFLKNRIKQFEQCVEDKTQSKDQIIRQNMFQLKRQLVAAKMEINKNNFLEKRTRANSKSKQKNVKHSVERKIRSDSSEDSH